jgi:hypothetical protein
MGEAIAHLNHLVATGHLRLIEDKAGIRYRRLQGRDRRIRPSFQ